jgi:branched-chain amino acid transport system substrate-binding protein
MAYERPKGSLASIVVVVLLGLVMSACGSGDSNSGSGGGAGSEYKVLLLAPKSGAAAATGKAFEAATRTGIDLINADGGIDGKKMSLKVVDDAGDPQVGVTAMQAELASGANYDLIIPGVFGAVTAAVVPTLVANPALQMSSATAVNDPKKYPRYFSTGPGLVPTSQSVVAHAKEKGYKHVGVMAIDNASSRAILDVYKASGDAEGIQVDTVVVPANAADATPQWQQLMSKNVDAIVLAGFDATTASVSIIKGKVKLGHTPPVIADNIFGANALKSAGIANSDVKGIELQSTKFTVARTPESTSAQMKSAMTALAKYSDGAVLPLQITTIQILTIALAADAANAAGSTAGDAVAKKLEEIDKSKLPHSYGPAKPFSSESHALNFSTEDFTFFPMTLDTDDLGFKIPG